MAMGPMIQAASTLAGVNLVFLLLLTGVWVRNYRAFGTSLVFGLLVFAAAMLVENALALYFFFTMQNFYAGDAHVQQAVLVLRALQLVAIAFLTYVTVK